ncbi:Metallo-dependent phosphatase-like protein [Durotheca rogersii]|uniref:Metallo-dependent phosphatase-like protein n=1 Tax=Durotheca rogersii TaxID=419775 RepID=UPI00221F0948|nr:Metallo-dependent phosphatase-like protein [Durotheca rogersii]KAI5864938.1 Metallo-dependent phosphatase-like protein [Durotheca rogersii]
MKGASPWSVFAGCDCFGTRAPPAPPSPSSAPAAVQIISDLHLEAPRAYDVFEIAPRAPYLALLGDVGNVARHEKDYLAFLTRQLKQFRAVLLVPGNHEPYHSSWAETLGVLRAFEDKVRKDRSVGDFILLDRAVFRLPGTDVAVLGCSLFSSVPAESHIAVNMGLNDFYRTSDWDVEKHNEAHQRDLAWLNAQVAELEQSETKIMIFSHWSPSQDARAVDSKHTESLITSGFSTDLSGEPCFKSDKVKLWAFGHTHFNCDFAVQREGAGPLRLVTNQRGYYFTPAARFDGEMTVQV